MKEIKSLKGSTCYIAQQYQYASIDDAQVFFSECSALLDSEPLKFKLISSLDKGFYHKSIRQQKEELLTMLRQGKNDTVNIMAKNIRERCLAAVGRSQIVIAKINPEIQTFGCIEEILTAKALNKDVFLIIPGHGYRKCPIWLCGLFTEFEVFDSLENLVRHLRYVEGLCSRLEKTTVNY